MNLHDYDVIAIDPASGRTLGYLTAEQMTELRFSIKLNDIGALAMTIEKNVEALWDTFSRPDILFDVRRNGVVEATYLLSMRQLGADGNKEYMVLGGMSLEQLIARRIIDPDDDSNLPNGGYVTKAGPVDDILRSLLREQLADLASTVRQMSGVTIADVLSVGDLRGFRKRYDELNAVVLELLRSSNIDVEVVRTEYQNIEIRFAPRGTDRSYTTNFPGRFTAFSPERGNLANPSYIEDWSESRSFVYVGGKGEGANRQILQQGNPTAINESPYGRRELFVDSRDGVTGTDLLTTANAELNEKAPSTEFDFDIVGDRGGSVYRTDFFLGDVVTVYWKARQNDVRINGIEFSVTSKGEEMSIDIDNIR